MQDRGFYVACEQSDAIGFSITLVYVKDEKDLQFSIMIGNLTFAIGYVFE